MTPERLEELEAIAGKTLPDGREVCVVPQIYNTAITIGPAGSRFVDDRWEYATPERAFTAYIAWDPERLPEPDGWIRHPGTGRRRPGGDAKKEYVRF